MKEYQSKKDEVVEFLFTLGVTTILILAIIVGFVLE